MVYRDKVRIVVTGGAGFIGGHLVERLQAIHRGQVLVLDNLHRECFSGWSLPDVTFVRIDIRNPLAVREAMAGCDVVFHLAAQSNVMGAVTDAQYTFDTNVAGTFNVLEGAKAARAKRFVFTSSREIYGEPARLPVVESSRPKPKNPYGASKLAGEVYCGQAAVEGLETVILRLANVYGPRDRDRVIPLFVDAAQSGSPLVIYGGDQVLDFVWIDTVVDAMLKAAFGAWVRDPVNIGSGQGTSIRELAESIVQLAGSNSPIQVIPKREAEVTRFVADVTAARRCLGLPRHAKPLAHLSHLISAPRGPIASAASQNLRIRPSGDLD
jgi:UDP-glucose 4-epimerase